MIIRPVSDLHIEFWNKNHIDDTLNLVLPKLETDKDTVLVLAGDIGIAHKKETWLGALNTLSYRFKNIIFITGNHFFYNNKDVDKMKYVILTTDVPENVHILENNYIIIDNVVFIGANLWTDVGNNPLHAYLLSSSLNDFSVIKHIDNTTLTTGDTVKYFEHSKKFILKNIRKFGKEYKTIVVTHHGCSYMSIADEFVGSRLNCGFVTELSCEIMDYKPTLWIHGHVHNSFDYKIGNTRIIVNPFGYMGGQINPNYNKELVINMEVDL